MDILATEECALSFQVLNEFIWQATQMRLPGRLSAEEAMRFVTTLRRHPAQPIDARTFDAAWAVSQTTNYGWWDSLIVASAIATGCDTLLTEDMQHGRVIDGVRITNPFRDAG